jgi:predicted amidohydrolase
MTSRPGSFLYNEQVATKRLKVASVAMACDRDPAANRIKIANTVDAITQTHPDVELVIFGEMILGWYKPADMPEYHRHIAEPISQETLQAFVHLAARYRIHLCFGMSEIDDQTLYNAQVLLNPQGEIQAVHRKWNLKPAEKKAHYQPGPVPVTITDIKGVKTGIAICSDAASPRAMWELMRSRLDLIILSLADDSDEGLFMAKFNARMYDAWIVTANRYGDENGCFWNGHMVVSDPCGELRATGQDQEQYLVYELGFAGKQSWLKRAMRNAWVKAPLAFHILRNWRRGRSYL